MGNNDEFSHHYTIHKNKLVDSLISSHLDTIRKRILEQTRDVLAIILIGGYSRGEGSVEIKENKIIPMGDYDFLIITRSPPFHLSGVNLEDLARAFGVGHIDVSNYWVGLLPYVQKKIFWYELKFGSKVIFGNEEILDSIPINGSQDIDLSDGISLMFNRLDGLLRYFDPRFFRSPPPKQTERTLVYEAIKGILACGDSLLVSRRKYHYSYRKRLNILKSIVSKDFPDLMQASPDFISDFEQATDFKLNPDFDKVKDSVKLWTTARKYLLSTIVYYWLKWIGDANGKLADFPKTLLSRSRFRLRDYMVYNFFSSRNAKPLRTLFQYNNSFSDIVRASLFLLASSITEDEITPSLLDQTMELISSISSLGREAVSVHSSREKWMIVRDAVDLSWASTSR